MLKSRCRGRDRRLRQAYRIVSRRRGTKRSEDSATYAQNMEMEAVATSPNSSFSHHPDSTVNNQIVEANTRLRGFTNEANRLRLPRPGSIHTTRLHQARAAPCQRYIETKPLGAPVLLSALSNPLEPFATSYRWLARFQIASFQSLSNGARQCPQPP